MAATPVPGLRVACRDCGRAGTVPEAALATWLGEAPTMRNIREALARLICSAPGCRSRRSDVWAAGEGGAQLIDADCHRVCDHCGLPRLLAELRQHPGTNRCPACVTVAKAAEAAADAERTRHPTPPAGHERCPRCRKPTIVREPKEGGRYFLGCTGFPACRWGRDLPSTSAVPRQSEHRKVNVHNQGGRLAKAMPAAVLRLGIVALVLLAVAPATAQQDGRRWFIVRYDTNGRPSFSAPFPSAAVCEEKKKESVATWQALVPETDAVRQRAAARLDQLRRQRPRGDASAVAAWQQSMNKADFEWRYLEALLTEVLSWVRDWDQHAVCEPR